MPSPTRIRLRLRPAGACRVERQDDGRTGGLLGFRIRNRHVRGTGEESEAGPSVDLSIGAPFAGQIITGTIAVMAGGVGDSASDLIADDSNDEADVFIGGNPPWEPAP
jgi:hypothetical protein